MRAPHVYLPVIGLLVLASLVTAGRSLSAARSGPQLSDVAGARYRLDATSAKSSGAHLLAQDVRRAGFRFAPTVAPTDRQAFLDAVAAARPEARRLIGLVDGLVDVRIGPTGTPGAIGLTEDGEPGYRVTIDLDLVLARYGPRGVQRTVLHELGHVVDHALLTDDVTAALDAGIPAGGAARKVCSGAAPPARSASPRASPSGPWATSGSISRSATRSRRPPRRSMSGARRSRASPRPADTAAAMSDTSGRRSVRLP